MDCQGGPTVITKVLVRGRQAGQIIADVEMEAEVGKTGRFENGGGGHKPKNSSGL